MSTQVLMPALSPTMSEGKLSKWLVKEGDEVKAGDLIAEIETDKAIMEFESSEDGTIIKLLIKEGEENIKVNEPIAVLDTSNLKSLSKDVASNTIRVCIINAGMVRTNFFENLNFLPGDDIENAISVDDISNSVANILTLNRNTVVDEINLSPAKKVVKFK